MRAAPLALRPSRHDAARDRSVNLGIVQCVTMPLRKNGRARVMYPALWDVNGEQDFIAHRDYSTVEAQRSRPGCGQFVKALNGRVCNVLGLNAGLDTRIAEQAAELIMQRENRMTEKKTGNKSHVAHHYVPKFLLKNWHAESGKLIQYEWASYGFDAREYTAKSVAKQDHLYSTISDLGEMDVSLEPDYFTAEVDTPAGAVLQKILSSGISAINIEEREIWARFLVAQLARTPSMIDRFRNSTEDFFEAGVEAIASQPGRSGFREYVRANAPNVTRNISLEILPNVIEDPRLVQAIYSAHWRCVRLRWSKLDFLIGDRPLMHVGPLSSNFLMVLPLAPRILFCAARNSQSIESLMKANESSVVKTINKDTVRNAARYVYSKDHSHDALIRRRLARNT